MFLPQGTRSEGIATGGAPGGKGSSRLGVIGTSEDRGGKSRLVEVSPQGRGGVNEVKCGLTGRLIPFSCIDKVPDDDELELWGPFSLPCANEGTAAVAGRIFLVRNWQIRRPS